MDARTPILALAVLLAGAPLSAETKNVDKTLPLNALGTITLTAHNERTEIRTWDRAEVGVHAQIEAWGPSSYAGRRLAATSVRIEGSPDHVRIGALIPEWEWTWLGLWGGDRPHIRYEITAPRTARWQIYEHNGSVRMEGLKGPLELDFHNGYASVDFASFSADSRFSAHNGTMELMLPASSQFTLNARGHHMRVRSDFSATAGPELRVLAHNASVSVRKK